MATTRARFERLIGLLVLAALFVSYIPASAADGDDAIYCYYAHTSGPAEGIEPGEKVKQGEVIGYSGNTGYGSGWTPSNPVTVPHLHFACSPFPPSVQEGRLGSSYWDWIDPDPSRHAGWGNPLASMYESGAAFEQYNAAGGQSKHNGRDYRASVGTPLYAVADGEVVWVSWWPTWAEATKVGHGVTIVLKIGGSSADVPQKPEEEDDEANVYTPRAAQGDPVRDYRQPLAPMWRQSPSVWWWRNDIYRWAEEYELNPNIIATLMQIESGGLPTAGSGAGALGLFQVVPRWHVNYDKGEVDSDLYEPDFNAWKGMIFYNSCLARADNDPIRAAACYNGGASLLSKDPAYWPDETKAYVKWFSWIEDAFNAAETNALFEQHVSGCSRPGGLCVRALEWQYAHPRDDNEPGGVAPETYEGAALPQQDTVVRYLNNHIVVDAPPFMVLIVLFAFGGVLYYFGDWKIIRNRITRERRRVRTGWGPWVLRFVAFLIVLFWFPLNLFRLMTAMDSGMLPYNNTAFTMRRIIENNTKLIDDAEEFITKTEQYLPDEWQERVDQFVEPLEKVKGIRDFWLDFFIWLGDDPVLTPVFRWGSHEVQAYLVPPEYLTEDNWILVKHDFTDPIVEDGQVVSLRTVSDARGTTNPWGLHGEQCYSCNNLKSWLGTDVLLPPEAFVYSPVTGVVENIIVEDGVTSVWISSKDVRFALVNVLREDADKLTVGQPIQAGDAIARPNGPHLHVVLELRNQDGSWADYPLTVLLKATSTPYQWFESQPPYFDPYVPGAKDVAKRSDYLVKEAPINR